MSLLNDCGTHEIHAALYKTKTLAAAVCRVPVLPCPPLHRPLCMPLFNEIMLSTVTLSSNNGGTACDADRQSYGRNEV